MASCFRFRFSALYCGLFLAGWLCACGDGNRTEEDAANGKTGMTDTLYKVISDTVDVSDTIPINQTDVNHLKQGRWEFRIGGRLWKLEFYEGGYRNGRCFEYEAEGGTKAMDYNYGQRSGYALEYHRSDSIPEVASYYYIDLLQWTAHPKALDTLLLHPDGFQLYTDSATLEIPYTFGENFYEGKIVQVGNDQGKPVGVHRIFRRSGALKAEIDYDQSTIVVFAADGGSNTQYTFQEWQAKSGTTL